MIDFQSYSQHPTCQDVAVAERYAYKRDGYFVDVGAYDGRHFSNTYALEKSLGWTGICLEPLGHAFGGLRACRSCVCLCVAAYESEGEILFTDSDVLSGITDRIDRWIPETKDGLRRMVATRTLTSILAEHKAPPFIEYLSIDTEGSELEVLKGIDHARWKFGYITLEHNFMSPRREIMRAYLEERGYRYVRENHFDDDYELVT